MGSRDEKSEDRQQQQEPRLITQLLAGLEREILMMLDEMSEILGRPTSRYDLFPRISAALHVYWFAKKESLVSHQTGPHTDESVSAKRQQLLKELDKLPRKEDEIVSEQWKSNFETLRLSVRQEIEESQNVFIPLLLSKKSRPDLEKLGSLFKKALQSPLEKGSPSLERAAGAIS